ncbi:MAG: CPBP family intramembrane metalloprotease [Bacteroidetes bacterium]|nr:CPBP family intramembrane metalloprotease [Bacteroidota bacterium]
MENETVTRAQVPAEEWGGLADQKKVSPVLLGFLSLPLIFLFYQGMGAILMLMAGIQSPADHVNLTRLIQGASQVFFLGIPVLLLILLQTRRLADYTFLNGPLSLKQVILIPFSVITIQPCIQWIAYMERQIPWPSAMTDFRDQMESLLKTMVTADSLPEFGLVLIVVAVIPAFIEEFYFRGYLLRNFSRGYSGLTPVLLTGVLFGLFHFNPFQLTGLFLLGVYFSFIVWWTRSLWAGILAHFVNNGLAVTMVFLAGNGSLDIPLDDPDYQLPWQSVVFSVILFSGCVWMLVRQPKSDTQ